MLYIYTRMPCTSMYFYAVRPYFVCCTPVYFTRSNVRHMYYDVHRSSPFVVSNIPYVGHHTRTPYDRTSYYTVHYTHVHCTQACHTPEPLRIEHAVFRLLYVVCHKSATVRCTSNAYIVRQSTLYLLYIHSTYTQPSYKRFFISNFFLTKYI
jgi:hypothetical protein